MAERDVRRYIKQQAKTLGGEVRPCKWLSRRGAPDIRLMLPVYGCYWVETKAPKGKLSKLQIRELNRMAGYGEKIAVLWSVEQAKSWFEKLI